MMKLKNIGIISAVVSVLVFGGAYGAFAIGTKALKTTLASTRYRVSFTDVKAGTVIAPGIREFTLFTLTPADQILSSVAVVRTPFVIPSGARVIMQQARARENGVDLTSCDVMALTDLSYVNFDNRQPSCGTYGFFDENTAVNIVLQVISEDGTDLSGLTAGVVDFYVTKVQ